MSINHRMDLVHDQTILINHRCQAITKWPTQMFEIKKLNLKKKLSFSFQIVIVTIVIHLH